jgi:predicted enzyme related to lactoylglutathione lyase
MGQSVVHFEIGCRNTPKTVDFYSKLFDWEIQPMGPAHMIATGSSIGIRGHITSLGHEPHNYITFYVHVEELERSLKKAESLGGKTVVPPTDVPGQGTFAWLADPEGTVVGLWKPAKA